MEGVYISFTVSVCLWRVTVLFNDRVNMQLFSWSCRC